MESRGSNDNYSTQPKTVTDFKNSRIQSKERLVSDSGRHHQHSCVSFDRPLPNSHVVSNFNSLNCESAGAYGRKNMANQYTRVNSKFNQKNHINEYGSSSKRVDINGNLVQSAHSMQNDPLRQSHEVTLNSSNYVTSSQGQINNHNKSLSQFKGNRQYSSTMKPGDDPYEGSYDRQMKTRDQGLSTIYGQKLARNSNLDKIYLNNDMIKRTMQNSFRPRTQGRIGQNARLKQTLTGEKLAQSKFYSD